MPMGKIQIGLWEQVVEWLKFAARLPVIALIIIAAGMFGWIGFWFIVRLCLFIYSRYLSNPW